MNSSQASKQYTSPAFVTPPQVCQIQNVQQCMYETTGYVKCKGPVTSGATDKQAIDKLNASTNDRMFNLMVDRNVWKA